MFDYFFPDKFSVLDFEDSLVRDSFLSSFAAGSGTVYVNFILGFEKFIYTFERDLNFNQIAPVTNQGDRLGFDTVKNLRKLHELLVLDDGLWP